MISSKRQTVKSIKYWLQIIILSLTMFVFIDFTFLMASIIVLSIISLYIENKSVPKILILTFDEAQSKVNSSIQYALEQQLKPSIISSLQLDNPTNIIETNESIQVKFLVNNYVLTVSTAKSNYFATLDETNTQISASQNDGSVSLAGAITMYPGLIRTVRQNLVILMTRFSEKNCKINITDGQVSTLKGDIYVLYDYSLTTQVIANFTGTIIHTTPPTLTIVY
ncbi:unnamed protein product [Rotaria sordida]|uniref:Uncharacterized protein n=1 Tax=Rotaria sordida TaxID=392033 RepID=A0A813QTE7_9BILA|nr:unnamed protein product [Rotaria sordida]